MARNLMGCTTADVAVAASNGALQPGSGPWPVYTTGPYRDTSVAITDLTDMAGNPVTQVTFGADGVLRYYSPDGDTSTHWLDVGQGLRIAVRPVSIVGPAGAVGPPGPALGGVLTTKGDIAVGQGEGVATRQPVGADGQVLQADSSAPTGLRWSPLGNLLTGNQASVGSDTDGLAALYNCTIDTSSVWALHGTMSCEVTCDGVGDAVVEIARVPVTPGTQYTALTHVHAGGSARSARALIIWRDGGWAPVGTTADGPEVTSGTGESRARVTAAAPEGAVEAQVVVQFINPGDELHYFDCSAFWEGDDTGEWVMPGQPVRRTPPAVVPADSLRVWGHSYMIGSGPGVTATNRASALVAERLGLPERNEAIGGATAYEDVNAGGASVCTVLQRVTRPNTRWCGPGGAHLIMWGLNDLNKLGNTAEALAPTFAAYRAAISRLRQGAIFEDTSPTVALGGVWWGVDPTTSCNSGSQISYASGNGGTVSITTPHDFPGGTLVIGVTSMGAAGGKLTGVVNGITYTINTASWGVAGRNVPGALRIPNVPAGPATYTFTVTDLTGQNAFLFDYWAWEAPEDECPVIAIVKQPKPLDYSPYGSVAPGPPTDAGIDALNAGIDLVAQEFGERVITVDTAVIDKAVGAWSMGDVHTNVFGNKYIADQVASALSGYRFNARPGIQQRRVEYGTAAPTGIRTIWSVGDQVINTSPSEAGSGGSKYVTTGWVCTVAGAPGTWLPMRSLTGN